MTATRAKIEPLASSHPARLYRNLFGISRLGIFKRSSEAN